MILFILLQVVPHLVGLLLTLPVVLYLVRDKKHDQHDQIRSQVMRDEPR